MTDAEMDAFVAHESSLGEEAVKQANAPAHYTGLYVHEFDETYLLGGFHTAGMDVALAWKTWGPGDAEVTMTRVGETQPFYVRSTHPSDPTLNYESGDDVGLAALTVDQQQHFVAAVFEVFKAPSVAYSLPSIRYQTGIPADTMMMMNTMMTVGQAVKERIEGLKRIAEGYIDSISDGSCTGGAVAAGGAAKGVADAKMTSRGAKSGTKGAAGAAVAYTVGKVAFDLCKSAK